MTGPIRFELGGIQQLQGRSTVKGQMGHVSTSFCVSKDNFDQFWEQTLKESKELGIEDPKLKRKEKIPKKIANFIHQDEPELTRLKNIMKQYF